MQPAKPRELGLFQARYGAEQFHLRAMFQLGLKADHVPDGAELVVLTQLHHRMRPAAGAWIVQADRFHRPEAQRFRPAFRHHLNRHTALEIGRVLFPVLEIGLFAVDQTLNERIILRLVHWAVDIVLAIALVPAALIPGDVEIDGLMIDDGGNGIEKGQAVLPCARQDTLRKAGRGQRAGGNDRQAFARQLIDPLPHDLDIGMAFQRLGDGSGENVPVHGQGGTGRHLCLGSGAHDERIQPAHLVMQQADRIGAVIVGTKAVGTDQFGQPLGLMRGRHVAATAHFGEAHRDAGLRQLPCCFRSGEAAADDMHLMSHAPALAKPWPMRQ